MFLSSLRFTQGRLLADFLSPDFCFYGYVNDCTGSIPGAQRNTMGQSLFQIQECCKVRQGLMNSEMH